MAESVSGRELRSTVREDGTLTLSLARVTLDPPGPGEVIVAVEAAPINPSDLGLLVGPADPGSAVPGGSADAPTLTLTIPPDRRGAVAARLGQSLPVGNEGAGTVIAAGPDVEDLVGKTVGMIGGAMFADHRKLRASDCIVLKDGQTAADGAAMFVNPLTALGFVETMRAEGHRALVNTAAASILGQQLNRICLADGIPLVNVVRSPEQAQLLRDAGATHVVDTSADNFREALKAAVAESGATIAFDAIGGGTLGGQILAAMEAAASKDAAYSRYGSDMFKQLYIYGMLDPGPTIINRSFGFAWSVGGWLLFPFLQKAGAEVAGRLRARVRDELTTTFATRYSRTIGLAEALQPEVFAAYERKATGEKFLIDPRR
ncbi:NADPH:quinone reductase [Sphingomonas guangdongensis]|uniref:NADPH:quinone reductase n=1 Tax=Sphingomonas guangdongensis TaxID=1141890 RepID=A0A285QXT2_9SPHN|nr:zinc-binding dehydrogenase [Sphingomonas guangdongensis]SOB86636.1 NADPH:quinone reductase [Sphingomonas guangdongensis]